MYMLLDQIPLASWAWVTSKGSLLQPCLKMSPTFLCDSLRQEASVRVYQKTLENFTFGALARSGNYYFHTE